MLAVTGVWRRNIFRFANSTIIRYVIVAPTRNAKYEPGKGVKPSGAASAV